MEKHSDKLKTFSRKLVRSKYKNSYFRCKFLLMYRTVFFYTTCENLKCGRNRASHTECENSYYRSKCEKVNLSSSGSLCPSEARLKRLRDDKITFSPVYRTLFFDMTCEKLNFGHAFLLERVRN